MKRSRWKGKYICKSFFRKNTAQNLFFCRNSIITGSLIDKNLKIYNGFLYKKVFVSLEKIGYKFGDFALTRKIKK
jgi:small subunit ribosomal protein S19